MVLKMRGLDENEATLLATSVLYICFRKVWIATRKDNRADGQDPEIAV
jgi:hypothetical protein